jgi:hypothetical protein
LPSALVQVVHTDRKVDDVFRQLETARSQVEDRFQRAGTILAEVLDVVSRLVVSLTELTDTMESEAVEATTRDLLAATDELSTIPETQSQRRATLEKVHAASGSLRRHIDDMRQTLRYLQVFALNIKITSAGLGAGEFKDFAEEMFERIEFGVGELNAFDRQLQEVSRQLSEALDSEASLEGQCALLLPTVRRNLAADAEMMRAHHRSVIATTASVAALAQAVQAKVGRALGALQIGDITRQRIEHVQTAIEMVSEFELAAGALSREDRDGVANAVHRMLCAQMADLVSDFRREAGRVTTSIAGMAEDTDQILRLRDLTYGHPSSDDGGILRALQSSVSQARSLVQNVQSANLDAERIASSTSIAAETLGGRVAGVRLVKTDIQQMALNTALRCSRLGDAGKPLNVIAVELRTYADDLDVVADQAATILNLLAADASTVTRQGGVSMDADAVFRGAIDHIRSVGDNAEEKLENLGRQGGQVADTLGRTMRQLDFHQDLSDVLEMAAESLNALTGDQDGDPGEVEAPLFELLDRIAPLYTMAREREIHKLNSPTRADEAQAQAETAGAENTEDELEGMLF